MKIVIPLSLLLTASPLLAQPQAPQPLWKVTIRVVDEDGSPVSGANVGVGYYYMLNPTSVDGNTDTNGFFVASKKGGGLVSCDAEKPGYYRTSGLQFNFKNYVDDQWQPWNTNATLCLKKIGKPVPMYAKQILSLTLPTLNKPIGYDLTIGDWVGPYGKGTSTDLFFTEKHPDEKSDYVLTMTFPNAGDGVQEFTVPDAEKGSSLRSPHQAPVDGYQPEIAQTTMTNPKRNLFFRARTILDERGVVKSALYGKIYGDLAQFTYYLNPTPNDRNMEFDPKHDLFSDQNIREP